MSTSSYIMIHFSERELACKHCGQGGCVDELKQALDDYRKLVRMPVLVDDAYRCEAHNATVSLVNKSEHPKGTAADIRVPGLTLQQMYDAAKQIPAFKYGGIGVYEGKFFSFIHVDVRNTEKPARWSFIGKTEGPISALVVE